MIMKWLLAAMGLLPSTSGTAMQQVRTAALLHANIAEQAGRRALDIIDRQEADTGTEELTESVAEIRAFMARATDRR